MSAVTHSTTKLDSSSRTPLLFSSVHVLQTVFMVLFTARELNWTVLLGVTIAQRGVLPNIQTVLLPKKSQKASK